MCVCVSVYIYMFVKYQLIIIVGKFNLILSDIVTDFIFFVNICHNVYGLYGRHIDRYNVKEIF